MMMTRERKQVETPTLKTIIKKKT